MPDYLRIKIEGGTYFFTLVTYQRKPLFLQETAIELFLESLNHVRTYHPFSALAHCILPDHVHLLWEMPINDANYSVRIGEIKKRFSKRFITQFENPFLVTTTQKMRGETGIWQRRFWEHFIRDEEDLKQHIDYIHYNPVKHGLVNKANEWSASSFFDYVKAGYYNDDWGQGIPIEIKPNYFGE
jgi:putative transposase